MWWNNSSKDWCQFYLQLCAYTITQIFITSSIYLSRPIFSSTKDRCPSLRYLLTYIFWIKKIKKNLFFISRTTRQQSVLRGRGTGGGTVDNAQTIIVNWQIAAVKRAESGIVLVTGRGKRRVNGKRRAINQRGNSS